MRIVLAFCFLFLTWVSVVFADSIDLQRLFAPPTQKELVNCANFLTYRQCPVQDPRIEFEYEQPRGYRIFIVSHLMGGFRHFGIVKIPSSKQSDRRFPVLVNLHGGREGVGVDWVDGFDDLVEVLPSFVGEEVRFVNTKKGLGLKQRLRRFAKVQTWDKFVSEGDRFWASPVQDADCAFALLDAVCELFREADRDFVIVCGVSRSGAGALDMAVRDPRVKGVVVTSGLSNIFCDDFMRQTKQIIPDLGLSLEKLQLKIDNQPFFDFAKNILKSLHDGEISLGQARFSMIVRSAVFFSDRFPEYVQIHHGRDDDVVSVEQSRDMFAALQRDGIAQSNPRLFIYPDTGHDLSENELYPVYRDGFIRDLVKEYYRQRV